MKILEKWRRPRWQHPDAAVRLKALAGDTIDDTDCQALAIEDPDPAVRDHAINRLESVDRLLNVLDARPAARSAIAARLAELLLKASAASVGQRLDAAVAVIAATPDADRLARDATDPAIRGAAVAVAADASTLRHCALEDRVVDVRVQAVQGIDDEAALDEIARAARGNDKTVARLAASRLADLRARRERSAERDALLDQLAALAASDEFDVEALQRLRVQWQHLGEGAATAQRERYAELEPRLDARLAAWRAVEQADRAQRAERERLLERLQALAAGLDDVAVDEGRAGFAALCSAWTQAGPLQDRWRQRLFDEQWQEATTGVAARLRERAKLGAGEQAIGAAAAEIEALLGRDGLAAAQLDAARQRVAELTERHGGNVALERPLRHLGQLVDRLAAEIDGQRDRLKALRGPLREALDALEQALEQRQLEPAVAAHRKASELLAEAGRPAELKSLQRRLTKSEPQLRELQSWRNWGSDHARDELVDEARALVDADIDVAERRARLKSLRARWKSLGNGGAKARRLWEAFDSACTAAYEPVKQDRKDQAKEREQHLAARAEICVRLEQLATETDWSAPDWRAVDRQLADAKRDWRSAGATPHKKWDAIRERFDHAVAALEQHLAKERRHNFLQRQALVKEAEALSGSADRRQAVAEARRLRDAWQVTVHSPRKDERALWAAFTAALDAVHARDREARDAFKADLEANRRQAEALCLELEQQLDGDRAEVRSLRGELARLSSAFGQLGTLPKNARQSLAKRFEAAAEAVRRRISEAEIEQVREALRAYQALHEICERAEALAQRDGADAAATEAADADWQASVKPPEDAQLLQALEKRFASAMRALTGDAPVPQATVLAANLARRRDICTDLEILCNQASPAASQAARLQRQVVLLEAAMKGGDKAPDEKVRRLQREYLCVGPIPADQQQDLAERFARLSDPPA